ncbi:DUF6092 family protein [Flexilinea flocculi]|uniref:Uncharacterized protein n=1 Tax=Flexilinea flocculi TaxID=1678840 RepID=A0A0S7BUG8_9CHLR|nr:DUF6092 family protein [Flexilinea flocculi]GAP40131.1 hypothetical protein ATC1_1397 [Flexilinea flocculi]
MKKYKMEPTELKNELFMLVSYVITSARGLYDEPDNYGIFRLIDSAGRLLAIMESAGMSDDFIASLREQIDEERESSMDDDAQKRHLDAMVLKIARELQKR